MPLTPYGIEQYEPYGDREGIALCLSGGGFRAALFHLGALRRLNELGVLHELRTIASVSGGSTIAAFLAGRHDVWYRPGGCDPGVWEREISAPFREIASRNFSTPSVLWGLPWWWTNVGVNSFARACSRALYPAALVQDLPERPNFQFCATELVEGRPHVIDRHDKQKWTVGEAVALSSAFPLIFWPYRQSSPFRAAFVDGGVADNRGIEAVWRSHQMLLVSDGGDVVRPGWSQALTYGWGRSLAILMAQMNGMQKRWLIRMFESKTLDGAYWGIGSAVEHYRRNARHQVVGYGEDVAANAIATIRLKYDAFTDAEARILENHGYLLADAAVVTHLRGLAPQLIPPVHVPCNRWLDDREAREALRTSGSSSLGGHGWIRACVLAIWRNLWKLIAGTPPAPRPKRQRPSVNTSVGT